MFVLFLVQFESFLLIKKRKNYPVFRASEKTAELIISVKNLQHQKRFSDTKRAIVHRLKGPYFKTNKGAAFQHFQGNVIWKD